MTSIILASKADKYFAQKHMEKGRDLLMALGESQLSIPWTSALQIYQRFVAGFLSASLDRVSAAASCDWDMSAIVRIILVI